MRNTLFCFTHGLKNAFAERAAYRTDYFMSLFILILSDLVVPFVSVVIYQNGAAFPGWSLYEILLIQGIYLITKGIAGPLFDGLVYSTVYSVKSGTYDMILLKPRSPIFISIISSFNIDELGKLFTGILMCVYALIKIGHMPSFMEILLFFLLTWMAVAVIFAFDLIIAATSFVWIGNSRLFEIFYSISNFGQYPAAIYPKILKNIVSYVIPVALMGFYPASALAGKFDGNTGLLALGTCGFLLLSLGIWKLMLPRYMSAGG